ncbi:MAG: NTP transferase domain-containing protein [Planctomycetota bacterium]
MSGAELAGERPPPVLVLLAAGASRRLDTCKALVALRAFPPATPLALLLEAGAVLGGRPPLCVTGADHAAIAAAAPGGVELLWNPQWSAGRTGSVRLAARRMGGADLCLAPVDVPLVPRRVFALLAEAWRGAGHPPRGWLAPRLGAGPAARYGHPVVIGRELAAELAGFAPDRPLRKLRERARPLLAVETDSPAILAGLDEPADLPRLRALLAAGEPR